MKSLVTILALLVGMSAQAKSISCLMYEYESDGTESSVSLKETELTDITREVSLDGKFVRLVVVTNNGLTALRFQNVTESANANNYFTGAQFEMNESLKEQSTNLMFESANNSATATCWFKK